MPNTKRAAVEAVTSGDDGSAFTVAQIVQRFEGQYVTHIRRDEVLTEKGATIKNRLYAARALECAAFLVEFYTRLGMTSLAALWEGRRRTAEAKAFRHKNRIAENIGAGPDGEDD